VSTPKPLNDSATAKVFNNDLVLTYNTTGNYWIFPPNKIEPTYGYWVYSFDDENASLTYKTNPETPTMTHLVAGWNMIGHTSKQNMNVTNSLSSIDQKYSYLLKYTHGGWLMHIAGADNSGPGRFYTMEPGIGYWIFMTEPADYTALSA